MKRTFTSIIIALVCCIMALADGFAQAYFPVRNHDFGYIKEAKGPVSYTFELQNKGTKPLIIVQVTASCGCTRPQYSTRPIKPGKKGKIKITYSPYGRPGAFEKIIKVKTNGREKRTVLMITGTVIPRNK